MEMRLSRSHVYCNCAIMAGATAFVPVIVQGLNAVVQWVFF